MKSSSIHELSRGIDVCAAYHLFDYHLYPGVMLWEFQLGPNVSISVNVRIGPGARLIGCIILDGEEVKVCLLFKALTDPIDLRNLHTSEAGTTNESMSH